MKTVNLNIRIKESMRDDFNRLAESNAQTPSLLVRKWIEEYINDIKNKEMLKMQNLVNEIRKNYKVDGENERYIEIYKNVDEVLEEQDKEQFEERFLSGYVQKVDDIEKLNYPIITFDYSGDADGKLFEANEDKEDVLNGASEYFMAK